MSQPSEGLASFPVPPDTEPKPRLEYTPEERSLLVELAHEAILSLLEGRELLLPAASPHLSEARGVFTTLYLEGKLRGCVGFPTPVLPTYRAVAETARGAAFEDPRFHPLSREEARRVQVSLSVLSLLRPILAEAIEVGRHGLLISEGDCRGLLLPQVATDHGWDRIRFLEQACRKAGLPLDAWRNGATIEAFTAEVFGDER